ncbi:chemotaxis protein CheB [Salipiger mucosus]|uniref:protein-glutamate methylesterase n=1 Tax=Salipiger mucosus DSM 16094 TaxID=1123237 RepID=S9S595_9RHOB|nr:chemotaxis protein CheB [Salipiger mucosus]EPX85360.1 Chemotaxis response regulator protein-glutamate methylesterase CheB [Salipiger mucosus DSM 16094]
MKQITLVIAHPDQALRDRLAAQFATVSDISVVARTRDLMETYAEVEEQEPKAVLIDESLARREEFEVMRALFATLDVRWLVITGQRDAPGRDAPAPWVRKSDIFSIEIDLPVQEIIDKIRSLTHSARQRARAPSAGGAQAGTGPSAARTDNGRFILIGASTGGVDALLRILAAFPSDCPPTFIVQHTGGGFGESLARLLDRQCAARVRRAVDRDQVHPGEIVIAAGSRAHLILKGGRPLRTELVGSEPVSGHMPSVDCLFESAVPGAPRAAAALLTGMGRDGAAGMKRLRDAGATTIAQDEASSVVFGMPRAAIDLGAAQSCLPLDQIGPALLRACSAPAPAKTSGMTAK